MTEEETEVVQTNFSEFEREHQYKSDLEDDFNLPVSWALDHLTHSKVALSFFNKHQVLHDLKPIADQIMATNYLDWRGAEYYKFLVDGIILNLMASGYGNSQYETRVLDVARTYLHQLIDGCKGGYRGRLATEIRRVFRTEINQPIPGKKGFFRR